MVTPLLVGRAAARSRPSKRPSSATSACAWPPSANRTPRNRPEDLFDVGTVIRVLQIIRTPDETLKILVEGATRVRHRGVLPRPMATWKCRATPLAEELAEGPEIEALSRSIKDRFKEYVRLNKRLPDEVLLSVLNLEEIGRMADSISAYILGKVPLKQELLEETIAGARLTRINQILAGELDILEIEQRIDGEVQTAVQRNQREFYLNEQLRAIRKELGYSADEDSEIEDYGAHLAEADMSPEALEVARREVDAPRAHVGDEPEATVVRNYLDTLLALPWKKKSRDRVDPAHVRRAWMPTTTDWRRSRSASSSSWPSTS